MDSATESSIFSRLQSSTDLADIPILFSNYLHPFDSHLAPKKPSSKTAKTLDTTAIRSLAKQFLPFLNKSLGFLPKLLSSEARSESPNKISLDCALKLFDVYRLCISCLHLISSQLECKPYSIQLQQFRLVHCLEEWKLYKEAESEGLIVLENLRGIDFGNVGAKSVKSKARLVPTLNEDAVDQEFALLVVQSVVTMVNCALMNKSKDDADYKRVLTLVDEVTPWFKVLDSKTYEKLHRMLVGHLNKIVVYLVEEFAFFDLELVLGFCKVTFSEYQKSSFKDQTYKFAWRICCSLFSKESSQFSYISGLLKFVLSSMAAECKLGVDYTITEFLELVHYCATSCQTASTTVCSAVAGHLNTLAGSQAIPLVGSMIGLYATGLLIFSSDYQSRNYSKDEFGSGFSLHDDEVLQQVPLYLDLMKEYFHIDGDGNGLFEKETSYLLSYYNALKFFCQPLAEFIYRERKEILDERDGASFITNSGVIHNAFHQFCYIVLHFPRAGEKSNAAVIFSSDENTKVITHVSVATLILSIKTGHHIKESVNLVKRVISSNWIQANGLKYLFASLYNVAIVFYRNKQMKEASKALKLSCKASWNRVVCHCKSAEIQEDLSEKLFGTFLKEATDLVNEASEKTAFLLDILSERNRCKMNKPLKDSLERWSIAENMFKSLPPPLTLVSRWVKIEIKLCKNVDVEHSPATLYNLLSTSVNVSKRALGVLLEQELFAYKAVNTLDPRFCLKIRMEIIDILLEKIYVSTDTYVQKSRLLIAKGAELREFGIENLDACIQCLSDAISTLRDFCQGDPTYDSQALHLMASAYCLRALSTQETTEANSKVLLLKRNFEDIQNAVNLWLDLHQSPAADQCNKIEDVVKFSHYNYDADMFFHDMLKMLFHVLDLLSIKGYIEIHADIYEILIRLFKLKKLSLEEALAMLWKSRRVGHGLCASPMSDVFISKLSQHYGELSKSIEFWITCMQPSQALLVGFQQRFFSVLPISLQSSFHHESLEITCNKVKSTASGPTFHGSVEGVKLAASDLISGVPTSSTAIFLSAHLYYDLSERLIMKGQIIEALSYAKEAHQLRSKLLQQKFRYSVENQSGINVETGDGTQNHCYSLGNFQMHDSVATEAWLLGPPCGSEGYILTSWNVLQCYLESTLQVANIHEILGEVMEAESLLLWGKDIALRQCLPPYSISFSSMLGKLYRKQMLWELAERELKAALQMMADNCNMISCLKCRTFLDTTIYQQLGDLFRSFSFRNIGNCSIEMSSRAVEKYRSALHKLDLFEWDTSSSSFVDTSSWQAECTTRSSFFNCSMDPLDTKELPSKTEGPETKTQKKRSRKTKKDDKPPSLHGQCLVAGHHLRMTRSRCRALEKSCESISGNDQGGRPMKSNSDNLFACNDATNQRGLTSEIKTSVADSTREITSFCNKIKCWHCLALEALKSGSLSGFVHMNWELVRRRSSLTLLISIGKCLGAYDNNHKAHHILLLSLSLMVNPYCPKYSSLSSIFLIDLINKDIPGEVLAVEHAMLLYSLCRIAVKCYPDRFTRESGCQLSCIGIPRIFSWLKMAYVLCCEVPLLSQKVSRLLTVLYVLSTSVEAFSLSPDEALSESHWASFFHQASIGTHFNQQLCSGMMRKPKGEDLTDLQGSCLPSTNSTSLSMTNFLRLAPESQEDLDEFVKRFFQKLPCTTIICISVIGGADAILLRELLCCASAQAWILLSRLNSKSQPVLLLLPIESTLEEASFDAMGSSSVISTVGEGFFKQWHCPWVSTVVDEIAPVFKTILKENYLSSAFTKEDTKQNRLLWWSQRKRLDDCLGKFLQHLEDLWLGPWKYLLLGNWADSKHISSLEKKLMDDLMLKCKVNVHKDLVEVILGGAKYASEIRECGLQLILNKGCYIGGCCEALSNASIEVKSLSTEVFEKIFETDHEFEEINVLGRKPVTLVLDSEVQMLPWESLPILRNEEVYRMPSVTSICATLVRCHHHQEQLTKHAAIFPVIDPLDSFFVLNPSGDLSRTQVEFESWFKDQKFEGKTGSVPTSEELVRALKIHDLFIYIGHGSGSQYIPGHEIKKLNRCAATLLMGCSSGSLSMSGCYAPRGTPLCYLLAGSPVTVANLWEVTDKDIDRFGKAMLDAWLRERSVISETCNECDVLLDKFKSMNISETIVNRKERTNKSPDSCDVSVHNTCNHRPKIGSFMAQARNACNLPFLIGASPVCYGVPTGIAEKKRVVISSP